MIAVALDAFAELALIERGFVRTGLKQLGLSRVALSTVVGTGPADVAPVLFEQLQEALSAGAEAVMHRAN